MGQRLPSPIAPSRPRHPDPSDKLAPTRLQRLRAGDVRAFSEVLDDHWADVVRYAEARLDSRDAAEDAAQETFSRLWIRRSSLRRQGRVRPLLYRMVHNVVMDEIRKRQVRSRFLTRSRPKGTSAPSPAELFEGAELATVTRRAIDALPDRRKDVFLLGQFHDLSYREIGEVLGITPRTVANHMSLALSDLREALGPFLDQQPDEG
jgi:RNA polymerase sigma-70 factor (family 1)